MGDFNAEISEPNLASFCNIYNFKNIINKPTCCKNSHNTSCIYLILTYYPNYFQNLSKFETGLSDFHRLILTLFKSGIPQQQTRILSYQNYKRFNGQTLDSVISKKIEENASIILKSLNVPSPIYWTKMSPSKRVSKDQSF